MWLFFQNNALMLLSPLGDPHTPLLLSPLPSAHYSPLQLNKLKQHKFSLSICSSLVWTSPVLSGAVQSNPVVPYLETLWSADLMAYLFTELLDMHVCFYRFPSMLLCVGHTAPHVTEETEWSPRWTAESYTQWCDIQATRHKDYLMKEMCERLVVSLPVLHTHW